MSFFFGTPCISSTLSKVIELYILESCSDHHFHDLRFGFVTGQSTDLVLSCLQSHYLTMLLHILQRWR